MTISSRFRTSLVLALVASTFATACGSVNPAAEETTPDAVNAGQSDDGGTQPANEGPAADPAPAAATVVAAQPETTKELGVVQWSATMKDTGTVDIRGTDLKGAETTHVDIEVRQTSTGFETEYTVASPHFAITIPESTSTADLTRLLSQNDVLRAMIRDLPLQPATSPAPDGDTSGPIHLPGSVFGEQTSDGPTTEVYFGGLRAALWCMLNGSKSAYKSNAQADATICQMHLLLPRNRARGHDGRFMRAYIDRGAENLMIAFRGSAEYVDAGVDLRSQAWKSHVNALNYQVNGPGIPVGAPTQGRIGEGWDARLNWLAPEIFDILDQLRARRATLPTRGHLVIWVTGHSLGGVLATVAARDITEALRNWNWDRDLQVDGPPLIAAVPFNPPRTGFSSYNDGYQALLHEILRVRYPFLRIWQFTRMWDPVSSVPVAMGHAIWNPMSPLTGAPTDAYRATYPRGVTVPYCPHYQGLAVSLSNPIANHNLDNWNYDLSWALPTSQVNCMAENTGRL